MGVMKDWTTVTLTWFKVNGVTTMRITLLLSAVICLSFGAAQAATIGTYTFDDNAFADAAEISTGVGGAGVPAAAADGDLGTEFQLNMNLAGNPVATVAFSFTDNVLFNGPGIDLIAFGDNNNGRLRLERIGVTAPFQGAGLGTFGVGEGGALYGGGINGWDLSDFGFADGEAYTTGLRITPEGNNSRIYDIAALNSRAVVTDPVPGPSAVPLPEAGWLLLGSLAGMIGLRRRKAIS